MAQHTPGADNVVILVGGNPVSNVNPLPTTGGGGGGGGIVDQGTQGSIAQPWFVQPTADGATVSLPLPAGAATAAKQDTGNTSLASIDGKLPAALTGGGGVKAGIVDALPAGANAIGSVSVNARSATPARTFVNSSATSVTLLASNAARKSATFYNNSSTDLYLCESGGTADATSAFTVILKAGGGYYELPIGADNSITTSAITGIWASAGTSGCAVCERV